jgi:hypothetical protein
MVSLPSKRPWREVVKDLLDSFEREGPCISLIHPIPEAIYVMLEPVFTCRDPLITEDPPRSKQVRQWLWDNRKKRSLNRVGGFLYATTSEGGFMVGYGTLAEPKAASRYQHIRSGINAC